MTTGAAAQAAEAREHAANDQRCSELGWSCIPLAVESYGAWGKEVQQCFSPVHASLRQLHTVHTVDFLLRIACVNDVYSFIC